MAAANAPITMKETLTLPSIGINPQFINFTHVTMESDKYICIRETAPQNSVVIIDMNLPMQPLRRPMTADSALMNPNSRILALKAQIPGTTQDLLQIYNMEMKAKVKSHQMPEQVVFWKWISANKLGLVTQTSVYHWAIEGDSEPVKMFDRTANLTNNQIINYRCDPNEKWLALIGIAPGPPERPQLVKGNMQLFSVDQQRSQALEAHAASFATFKVPGNESPSTLISFATKSFNAGQITSKLHVIELGAQPGKPSFTKKQADLFFPPDFADDFPTSMQISQKYGLIYVITKQGLLFVYDLETATAVYRNRISPDPIFLTIEASSIGGFYAINGQGQVLLATVNEATIIPFISSQLNNPELAVNLAKRGNLPGAENLAASLMIEIDDDVLESEVFAQLDLLDDFLEIERSMPPSSKDKIVEEEKNNPDIPCQESINAASHLLLELLNGNPSELCQVVDQNKVFNAAEVLSKAPTLDASKRMFWSNFPTVYKNFSQQFMNEKKVVSEATAATDLARQCKNAVEKKKSIYEKVKNNINTQMKLHQDNLDEIAKLEACLAELKKATTKEEDNLKSLKAERSKLLVELKEEGREALAAKSEAAKQEEKAKEANNMLQQMKDEWATWMQNLC